MVLTTSAGSIICRRSVSSFIAEIARLSTLNVFSTSTVSSAIITVVAALVATSAIVSPLYVVALSASAKVYSIISSIGTGITALQVVVTAFSRV
jgi:hypothetical protein